VQKGRASIADAYERANEIEAKYGIETDVLDSDDFGTLTPGYWVVYSGDFYDRLDALTYADLLRDYGIDACAREISWS